MMDNIMIEVKNNEIKIPEKIVTKKHDFQSLSPKDRLKKHVIDVLHKDGGKYIRVGNETYLLIAGAIDNNTVCFVVLNSDRKIELINAKTRYRIQHEVPIKMSVLDLIYTRQPVDFKNQVDAMLENYDTFTLNHMKSPLRNTNRRNKNYKNYKRNNGKHRR